MQSGELEMLISAIQRLHVAHAGLELIHSASSGVAKRLWDNRAFERIPVELVAPLKTSLGSIYGNANCLSVAELLELSCLQPWSLAAWEIRVPPQKLCMAGRWRLDMKKNTFGPPDIMGIV